MEHFYFRVASYYNYRNSNIFIKNYYILQNILQFFFTIYCFHEEKKNDLFLFCVNGLFLLNIIYVDVLKKLVTVWGQVYKLCNIENFVISIQTFYNAVYHLLISPKYYIRDR